MDKTKVKELKEMADELMNCGNSKEIAEGVGIMRAIFYLTPTVKDSRLEKIGNYLSASSVEEYEKMLSILENLDSESDKEIVDYIDGIQVLELYEFSLTVAELWGFITEGE